MDKYFIFVDNNLINGLFVFLASIIITIIILIVCKKLFKFNCSPLIFFVFIITRLIIGGKIIRNENTKFINSSIHSIVIEQDEWRRNMYRNKLKNGLIFYTEDEVLMGDSIVKNGKSNTYQKYKKDYNGNYVFVKEYNY
jgi:hypothetical protein